MSTQVAGIYGVVAVDLKRAIGGLRDFRSRLLGATNNLKTLRDQAKITGAALTAAITIPAAIAGKSAIDMVGDYEKAMSIFQTITQATSEDMAAAAKIAVDLGNDIKLPGISAGDAAEGLAQLAKGGLSAKDSMDALRGTLQLASAGQISAAEAASIVTDALNAFKLPGTEAARVADLLAAASVAAGSSISDNALAMQQAGTVWAMAGIPLNELVTSIALLARAGIQGSDAGTSLKTMMTALIAPTEEGAAMMRAMGISVYDAAGNMKPFPEIIAAFQKGLTPLTEAQRNQRLETIFGSDAIRAASVILGGGTDAFASMAAKVNEAGAAEKLAAASSAGLGGAIEGLKSSWDTLLLKTMLQFSPVLQWILGLLASAVSWFGELDPAVQRAALAFVATLAVLGPIAIALSSVTLEGLTFTAMALVAAVALAGWAAGFGYFSTTFGPIADGMVRLQKAADEHLMPALSGLGDVVSLVLQGKFQEAWSSLSSIYGQHIQPFLTVLSDVSREIWGVVLGWAGTFIAWVAPVIPQLLAALAPVWTALSGWITGTAIPGVQKLMNDDVAPAFWKFIDEQVIPNLPPQLQNLIGTIRTWAQQNQPALGEVGKAMGGGIIQGLAKGLADNAPQLLGAALKASLKLSFPYLSGLIDQAFGGSGGGMAGGGGGSSGVSGNLGIGGKAYGPGGIPAFAEGGIVTRPTLALIGERGPEAVTPLGGGRGGGEINVYITGPVYGVSNIEDLVVQAVTKAQQRGRLSPAF